MNRKTLNLSYVVLIAISSLLFGCSAQIVKVNIVSDPSGAEVFSNQFNSGRTPLLTSKDAIIPLWDSDDVFSCAVITLRKLGFVDYRVLVNEFSMPDLIKATLVPLPEDEPNSK